MFESRVTADCHDEAWIALAAAWREPLPDDGDSSARLVFGISFEQDEDGAVRQSGPPLVSLRQSQRPPNDIVRTPSTQVDFVASPAWCDPRGVILLGIVTIIGADSRQHLIEGAEVLVAALRAELQTVAAQHDDFQVFASATWPTAEKLVEMAHA